MSENELQSPHFEDLTEKQESSLLVYEGKIFDLRHDTVRLPNGHDGVRDYIVHKGAACIVPVTDDGCVLTVRQYRYPFKKVLIEIPAGKLDSTAEDPLDAAKRELKEETGAEAAEFTFLGEFYPTCAYSTEILFMYMATGLSFGSTSPDDDEFIETEKIPLETLVGEIMNGNIKDGKTQAAVLKAYFKIKETKGE